MFIKDYLELSAHYDLTAPPVQITDVPRDYVIKRQSSDFARDSSTEFCDRSQFIPLETSLGSGPSNSVDIENQRSGSPTYLAELGAQNHRPMSTTLQHSSSSNSLKIEPIQQQGMPSAEMTPNGFGDCGVGMYFSIKCLNYYRISNIIEISAPVHTISKPLHKQLFPQN